MNDRLALQGIGGVLVFLALGLVILGGLVASGVTKVIVPRPESPAEQLVTALGAHRYEGGLDQLSQELSQQVSQGYLQQIAEAIERSHRGIDQATGQDSQQQGETATAMVQVKFKDQSQQIVEFPLVKENGIWKVASLAPLEALGQ